MLTGFRRSNVAYWSGPGLLILNLSLLGMSLAILHLVCVEQCSVLRFLSIDLNLTHALIPVLLFCFRG